MTAVSELDTLRARYRFLGGSPLIMGGDAPDAECEVLRAKISCQEQRLGITTRADSDGAAIEKLTETADNLSRRLNALESTKRAAPPFDRSPKPVLTPEQQFQQREQAAGRLTMVTEHDEVGRPIRRFYGDPELVWGAFKVPSKLLVGINTKG